MSAQAATTYDFVAIGAGPFNLGLGCLADPVEGLSGVVLEQRPDFAWHPGMMLDGATIQVPFLADLVTLADPTSPYSFLAFLKETGRLYSYYIRESFFPLRSEYSEYCRWAAHRLGVRFGHRVVGVRPHEVGYAVATEVDGRPGPTLLTRTLVLGTGTVPHVPEIAGLTEVGLEHPVVHSADYLHRREELRATGSVTVIGSGQSAAEIYRDLLEHAAADELELTWLTRSPRFFPMEYTKLTLELTSPDYARHRRALPADVRERLNREERTLYKGISAELVDDIFDSLYRLRQQRQVQGRGDVPTTLLTDVEVTDAAAVDGQVLVGGCSGRTGDRLEHRTGGLVLATGYRPSTHDFLDEAVRARIATDDLGRYAVAEDYSVDAGRTVFVQNAEEHLTGVLAPDLGMGAFRSSVILNTLCGREVYPVEERIAFQEFGIPDRMRPARGNAPRVEARELLEVAR